MKHTIKITMFLLAFFVLSQVVGLYIISTDATVGADATGIIVTHGDTTLGARPQTVGFGSFLYLAIGIAIGTVLVLLLAKFQKANIWRAWFFIAVWMALSISIGVFIKAKIFFDYDVAMFIALILALWKIYRPNVFIHNFTEVLMYSGIALLIAPLFDILWVVILLLAISVYDMYAVWKSKHMVTMAKFQTKSNVFAGLMIPYKMPKGKNAELKSVKAEKSSAKAAKSSSKVSESKNAILGGGDVVFPLIFSSVVMENLLTEGLTKSQAFLQVSIITLTTTIALALLFFFAKKDRFYPAMPFVTAGCLLGWGIVLLL